MPPLVAAEAGGADTARPAVMVAAPSSAPVTAAATARRLVEIVKVKDGRKADSRKEAPDRPGPTFPGPRTAAWWTTWWLTAGCAVPRYAAKRRRVHVGTPAGVSGRASCVSPGRGRVKTMD